MSSTEILHQSTVHQDLETIRKILEEHKNWKVISDDGETVLHLAFKCKSKILLCQDLIIQILECFLDKGLSVDTENAAGQTILFPAVEHRLVRVINFLLERGANLNVRDQNGNSIVHLLIEDQFKKYYENFIKTGGFDLIHILEQDDIAFVNWLLAKGVDVDIQNNDGKTALTLAIERNLQHVMPTLINFMNNVNYIDEAGCTIIQSFFKRKTNIIAKTERAHIEDYRYNSRYEVKIVESLLKRGLSVDHIDKKGNTLVLKVLKLRYPNPETIQLMIKHCTNVNAQDEDGNTALHLFIRSRIEFVSHLKNFTIDIVRTLLSKGANVNLKNNSGESIVQQAFRVKNTTVLKTLLASGADVSPSANPGTLFLHEISNFPSIQDQICAPMVDTLVQAGWNVNDVRPSDGFTPLMEACRSNCPAITQKLIDNGANVNYVEKQKLTRPIHMVVAHPAIKHENAAALFEILSRAGADVNAKNRRGETALHLAPFRGYSAMQMLLVCGAHVDVRDKAGRLPLHRAIREGQIEAITALLAFGAAINDEDVLREMRHRRAGRKTCDYLTQQWLKLKAANLPAIDGYEAFAENKNFQGFNDECLREVKSLKEYYLNDRITLYDLLRMNVNFKYVFIVNNKKLNELIMSSEFNTSFQIYGIFILACFIKAHARYRLIEPAKQAWHCLTGIELPDCVEKILAYLENEDLRAMTEEEDEVNALKRRVRSKT